MILKLNNENKYWRKTFFLFCYRKVFCLVDLLHGWSTVASGRSTARSATGAGHSTLEALGHATAGAAVQLGEDRLHDSLQLLLTILVFFFLSELVGVEPSQKFRGLLLDRAAIIRADLVLELFIIECVLDVEDVRFEGVFGGDFAFGDFVFLRVFSIVLRSS